MAEQRTLAAPEQAVKTVADMMAHPYTQQRFKEFAPKFLDPERLFKIAVMAVHNNPKLGDADPFELLRAMLGVTQLGLEVNSPRRQAYLIPFVMGRGKKEEWIKIEVVIGYPGYIDLALRTGRILDVQPDVATKAEVDGDLFKYQLGDQPFLRHVYHPDRDEDKDDPAFGYCVLLLKGGARVFMVMPWKAIMRIRDRSPGYRSAKALGEKSKAYLGNPWVVDPFQMAGKTVIRRHLKFKPTSSELGNAMMLEDSTSAGLSLEPFIDLDPTQWRHVAAKTAKPTRAVQPQTDDGGEPAQEPAGEPAKPAAKPAAKSAKKAEPKKPAAEEAAKAAEPPGAEPQGQTSDLPHEPGAEEPEGEATSEPETAGDDDKEDWMQV